MVEFSGPFQLESAPLVPGGAGVLDLGGEGYYRAHGFIRGAFPGGARRRLSGGVGVVAVAHTFRDGFENRVPPGDRVADLMYEAGGKWGEYIGEKGPSLAAGRVGTHSGVNRVASGGGIAGGSRRRPTCRTRRTGSARSTAASLARLPASSRPRSQRVSRWAGGGGQGWCRRRRRGGGGRDLGHLGGPASPGSPAGRGGSWPDEEAGGPVTEKTIHAAPPLADHAQFLIATAARAPSVHNTQPWRFQVRRSGVELYFDPRRSCGPIPWAGK